SLYIDDKIRFSPRLSLNLGVRWEPYFPSIDIRGRDAHFELSDFIAGRRSSQFVNAPPGLFFPGDPQMPDGGAPTSHHLNSFAPRIGIVWDPKGDGRMTIRSAVGMLYDLPGTAPFGRFGFGPPWANTATLNAPPGGLTDPFAGQPGGNPYPQPSPPPKDALFVANANYYNLPFAIQPPYMEQWNLSVQKQVAAA